MCTNDIIIIIHRQCNYLEGYDIYLLHKYTINLIIFRTILFSKPSLFYQHEPNYMYHIMRILSYT